LGDKGLKGFKVILHVKKFVNVVVVVIRVMISFNFSLPGACHTHATAIHGSLFNTRCQLLQWWGSYV
jgi:hypothetical protein